VDLIAVSDVLSLTVVPSNDAVTYYFPDICAPRGGYTLMFCEAKNTNNRSVTEQFWFTQEVNNDPFDLTGDSDYKGRATNICFMPTDCYLKITDLKESDSKTYKCIFFIEPSGDKWIGEPGVNLTVTGNVGVYKHTHTNTHLNNDNLLNIGF